MKNQKSTIKTLNKNKKIKEVKIIENKIKQNIKDFKNFKITLNDNIFTSKNKIMGFEGIASVNYWEAVSLLLPDEINFKNRNQKPENDVVNSMLNYGYAILASEIAKNIVTYREENGRFTSRKELLKVAKLGPKAFEQCAGFMRITGGSNPLDATSVHPESYEAASRLLEKLGYAAEDIAGGKLAGLSRQIKDYKKMAAELEIGEITLRDIVKELEKPARDPRDEMPKPILRTDVLDIKDLKEGMVLKGTVRNVIDFGAFVDIGVHQDGLVHISQMSEKFIKHPLEAVSVGDIVEVRVLGVDEKKNRISLSMKGLNQ